MKLIYWEPAGEKGRNQKNQTILDIQPKYFAHHVRCDFPGGTELFLSPAEASELLGVDVPPLPEVFGQHPYFVSKGKYPKEDFFQYDKLYLWVGGKKIFIEEAQIENFLARKQIEARSVKT